MTTMTNDEIKKAYEICASANDCSSCNDCPDCAKCASAAALNLITEQEKEIERLKAEVKQTKIDVLNKAKERCDLVAEELEDEIDHYGSSAAYNCAYEIKKLIAEVQNDK